MSLSCKICQHPSFKIVGSPQPNPNFPRASERNYKILQCENCQYYFINPEIDLTQDEWGKLYEDDYFAVANVTPWQVRLHNTERYKRMKLIDAALKTEKGAFLDMGCGEGYVLREAETHGFKPYGIDIANNLDKNNKHYSFFKGNIFEANFPNNFFSAIYMDSVLEHINNPMETLTELKRILKPGGVFFVIVPNEDSLNSSFLKLLYLTLMHSGSYAKLRPFFNPYHIHGFNKISLSKALENSGYKNFKIKGFAGSYAFWKAHPFGSLNYFKELLMYPVGLLSIPLDKQFQLMAIATKD